MAGWGRRSNYGAKDLWGWHYFVIAILFCIGSAAYTSYEKHHHKDVVHKHLTQKEVEDSWDKWKKGGE